MLAAKENIEHLLDKYWTMSYSFCVMTEEQSRHTLAVVSRRTGLRPDLIRAWERRYSAVEPERTARSSRLYSDHDVYRLLLLRQALELGWRIGEVVDQDNPSLERLLKEHLPDGLESRRGERNRLVERHLRFCVRAIRELDGSGLLASLDRASLDLGRVDLFDGLLSRLVRHIIEGQDGGSLRTAHEHVASDVVNAFLKDLRGAYPPFETAPHVIVATPPTEYFELDALLLSATARCEGWNTTYLGSNLPAEEAAAAVSQCQAKVIAMSIAVSTDRPVIKAELKKLVRLLDNSAKFVVAGPEASTYHDLLESVGATFLADLHEFREFLNATRVLSLGGGERP
jgi:DNA-binding transcriptional MerR regulator